jgi:hypothetical protein
VRAVWPPTSSCAEQVSGHERSTSPGAQLGELVLTGFDFGRPVADAEALNCRCPEARAI